MTDLVMSVVSMVFFASTGRSVWRGERVDWWLAVSTGVGLIVLAVCDLILGARLTAVVTLVTGCMWLDLRRR